MKTLPIVLLGAALSYGAPSAAPPTFHKDVLRILQKNCQECHRPE